MRTQPSPHVTPKLSTPKFGAIDPSVLTNPHIVVPVVSSVAAAASAAATNTVAIIPQGQVGLLERLGRYLETRQPGLSLQIPFVDKLIPVDLREQVMSLPRQPVITKENAPMDIDAVIFYKIQDPQKALYEVANRNEAMTKLATTSMRNIIGELTLDQTLASRDKINQRLKDIMNEAAEKWGVQINRVELKDIEPPPSLQNAMQKELEAERQRRASIIEAEGEKRSNVLKAEGEAEAIRTVQQAEADMAKVYLDALKDAKATPEVIQLKYADTLERLSQGKGSTVIAPMESTGILGALAGAAKAMAGKGEKKG